MQDKHAGVIPSANILTTVVDVTPGHQFEGVFGMQASWAHWHARVGYNLYMHEKETVGHRTWSNDRFAIAHNRYSRFTQPLGTTVLGGNTATSAGVIHAGALGTGSYNDPLSPVDKHGNRIGANRDGWTSELYANQSDSSDLDAIALEYNKPYAPANFSEGGPLQEPGKTTSKLTRRHCEQASDGTTISSDEYTGQDVTVTGVLAGTLTPRYTVSIEPCITESQTVHSIVGAVGYRFDGTYPLVISCGGEKEFQSADRNSALESWRAWMTVGVQF